MQKTVAGNLAGKRKTVPKNIFMQEEWECGNIFVDAVNGGGEFVGYAWV